VFIWDLQTFSKHTEIQGDRKITRALQTLNTPKSRSISEVMGSDPDFIPYTSKYLVTGSDNLSVKILDPFNKFMVIQIIALSEANFGVHTLLSIYDHKKKKLYIAIQSCNSPNEE